MSVRVLRVAGCLFAVVFALPAQVPLVQTTEVPFPICGSNVQAVGDFDSSGLPDFVITTFDPSPSLGVVHDPLTPGGGTCTISPTGLSSPTFLSIRPARLNSDSALDAIVSSGIENRILDAYGSGNGQLVFTGTGPYAVAPATVVSLVAVGDLDVNGRDDVVVFHQQIAQWGVLEVFSNLATGWTLSWSYPLTASPSTFAIGDVDGDTKPDIVWTDKSSGSQSRLQRARGVGSGAFVLEPVLVVSATPGIQLHALRDLDGDGKDDAVMALAGNIPAAPVRVAFGAPAGGPVTLTSYPTTFDSITHVNVADFDADGLPDLLMESFKISAPFARPFAVLRGLGSRQFSTEIVLASQGSAPLTAIRYHPADWAGDGDVDFVRTQHPFGGGTPVIRLFENQTIYAPGCAGSGGSVPAMFVGTATPGNAGFAIGLGDALANSIALLGVSLARVPAAGCQVALDLGIANLVLPTESLGLLPTDAAGAASVSLPLPFGIEGVTAYAQWAVADPQGGLSFAGLNFSLSEAHTIYVW